VVQIFLAKMNTRSSILISGGTECFSERMQKGIAHWDKQNNDVPAPNCILKVQGEIIKNESL